MKRSQGRIDYVLINSLPVTFCHRIVTCPWHNFECVGKEQTKVFAHIGQSLDQYIKT